MNDDSDRESALATVPVHSIGDDQLLAVAAAAERRVEAVNKIKTLALRVTNTRDWTDQGGNPYMQVSGAEKVARLFGISWRLDEPVRENHDDGHFSYTFKGYFSMGSAEIEVVGTRSSKDPFFSGRRDEPIPPSEIDRNDVKKGAMTNCIGNGVSRLLGIRNLTWEELERANIKREHVGKVHYASADPNAALKLPNYGRHKGQPMDDPSIPIDELRYYLQGAEKSIADPEKARYKEANERVRDALKAEIEKRDKAATKAAPPESTPPAPAESGVPSDSAGSGPSFVPPLIKLSQLTDRMQKVASVQDWASLMNEFEAFSDDEIASTDRQAFRVLANQKKADLGKKK